MHVQQPDVAFGEQKVKRETHLKAWESLRPACYQALKPVVVCLRVRAPANAGNSEGCSPSVQTAAHSLSTRSSQSRLTPSAQSCWEETTADVRPPIFSPPCQNKSDTLLLNPHSTSRGLAVNVIKGGVSSPNRKRKKIMKIHSQWSTWASIRAGPRMRAKVKTCDFWQVNWGKPRSRDRFLPHSAQNTPRRSGVLTRTKIKPRQ